MMPTPRHLQRFIDTGLSGVHNKVPQPVTYHCNRGAEVGAQGEDGGVYAVRRRAGMNVVRQEGNLVSIALSGSRIY